MNYIQPFAEVSITGPKWKENTKEVAKTYFPNGIFMGGTESDLSILRDKFGSKKDQLFVCHSNHCLAPEEGFIISKKVLIQPYLLSKF